MQRTGKDGMALGSTQHGKQRANYLTSTRSQSHWPPSGTTSNYILSGVGALIYANYVYQTYFVGVFQPFPEQVAKPLRRALYYTNISLSPKDALKYYKQALAIADEIGMDPFSEEILGVKIQVSALMEIINQYDKAIEVLEIVRGDCLKWIELLGSKPGNEGKRTRVLGKAISISVKLGDLYANYYVQDKETAEERLVWAVETALKEKKRREEEGIKEGEGDWLTDEEFGGSLEVNNLSSSLAQQHLQAPNPPSDPSVNLISARSWALKALTLASQIPPGKQTDECSVACVVTTYNLGDIAEQSGDLDEARRRYVGARGMAERLGFEEGMQMAGAAVRRLDSNAEGAKP
ncbi:hypothetical protein FGG08_004466 [Glutinoglossum americanum]|uniref:Uncharacterized protein n=1 Tax=Glutinoglossum americanum TaxID=1670608 RepID=A0A9P8L2G1_9PEZI|nr:hypothetical protein FGG08_004466 [Glutinoglossum americanum]